MSLGGWIKLHRSMADHFVSSDPHSLAIWVHLLMLANHTDTKRQINGRVIRLMPGQLIASRKSLAERTGVNESKVERVLRMLESEQQIEQQGTAKFRVISIVNWSSYQHGEQVSEQLANSSRTADEQLANTPEEVFIPADAGTNTQEGKEREEKNTGAQGKPERVKSFKVADLVALGVDEKHARDWMEVRRKKRAAMTETALNGVMREALKADISLAEAIRICAEKNWQGFEAEWLKNKQPGAPINRQQQVEDANARVVREIAEREARRQNQGIGQAEMDMGAIVAIDGEVIHVG